jgi:transposase
VRFIEAFVDNLDLAALGLSRTKPAETGRPGYDPRDLLKLYVYGYLQRVRSSRRLEAEAGRNLELIWLLRGLRPDFKTIADFRREHRAQFKGVFRDFNLLCRRLELFGAELVAIDGAKFKAVNSPKRHYTAEKLRELQTQIDARIEQYLGELDAQDEAAEGVASPPTRAALEQKITQLRQRKEVYQEYTQTLKSSGQTEISLTDPDSRGQKKVGVGYNVQIAVDAKHHLIATATVVQAANDLGQLHSLATAAHTEIGVTTVVADAGYHEAGQLEQCEQANLTTYVSAPGTSSGQAPAGRSVYPKEAFVYDQATDSYRCPAGQTLPHGTSSIGNGKARHYYYHVAACSQCAQKAACTTAAYRKLSRLANEAVVERQAQRSAAHPEHLAARKTIVEHVFGTLREWGHDKFLCRGLAMVQAEFTLSALAYNLRRVLNLLSVPQLLAALKMAA